MNRRLLFFGALLCALLLIVIPAPALEGAKSGIELCLRSVIPSLLPFIFLSTVICGQADLLHIPFADKLYRKLGLPPGSEALLLLGWIGGYPIGARCICDSYRNKRISKQAAHHMLRFCNNAGPSFIFGVLSPLFTNPSYLWLLWLTQIVSSALTGFFLHRTTPQTAVFLPPAKSDLSQELSASLRAMAQICGWVILFRIVCTYLDRLVLLTCSPMIRTTVTGLLELTNGCFLLGNILNEKIRYILCSAMLCFGGLCVCLQTKTVTGSLGLRTYFQGKVLQTVICLLLSILTVLLLF